MELVIDGIPVEVSRKKIKNMYLYVKPPEGRVSVSAPLRMSGSEIARFVRQKRSWIERRQQAYRRQYEEQDLGENGVRPLGERDRAFLREEISGLPAQ